MTIAVAKTPYLIWLTRLGHQAKNPTFRSFPYIRIDSMILRRKTKIGWVIAFLVLLSCGLALGLSETLRYGSAMLANSVIYGFSGASDRANADTIRNAILETHKFKTPSVSEPSLAPVFCAPGSHLFLTIPVTCSIYSVTTDVEQERIIDAVKNLIVARIRRPAKIIFFEKENWIEFHAANYAHRGPEHVLKVFRIGPDGLTTVLGKDYVRKYNEP